ncbi:hypothetical protein C8R45DRAFT_942625 [Mycena sanguinolenta]|nr:hypothetical protein C8R45DRAFT_942625 [Mycena sanguinolenta]
MSHCYHHDLTAKGTGPSPPPSHSTLQLPVGKGSPYRDNLSHYHRLESLLDSALATLTLIRDTANNPAAPPAFTLHMTQVLRALCRHAIPAPVEPTGPSLLPPTSMAHEPQTATYAQAVNTATDHVATPIGVDNNTSKQPSTRSPPPHPPPPPTAQPWLDSTRPDLIFRFDLEAPRRKPHPVTLFADIGPKTVGNLHLGGFRWTRGGNLAVTFAPGYRCTTASKFEAAPVAAIWQAIRPLIRFPADCPCPRVDGGSSWHSVVVHDVPTVKDTHRGSETSLTQWLYNGGFLGHVEDSSILCTDEALVERELVPVRLALSSRGNAEFLVENGALLFGSRCRVSHYVARSKSNAPQRSRSVPSNATLSTPMPP